MKEHLLIALRYAAAAVAGYLLIVLGTTLILEVLLDGFTFTGSSAGALAVATAGVLLSGLAGGYLAGWIGGPRPVAHALGVLVFLTVDTTYVVTSGISKDPIWFDLVAGIGLMAATVLGGFLRRAVRRRSEVTGSSRPRSTSPAPG